MGDRLGKPCTVGISFIRGVKLTTHLRLLPRSKNGWSSIFTPQNAFMAWCSVRGSTGTTLLLQLFIWWHVCPTGILNIVAVTKGKDLPVLSLNKHHSVKAYLGSESTAPRILDLGTRWRCLVSFTPCRLTPRKRAPGTHWIVGWVEPRPGLDAVVKREIPSSCRDSNSRSSSPQPSGIPLRHPGSLVPVKCFTIWCLHSKNSSLMNVRKLRRLTSLNNIKKSYYENPCSLMLMSLLFINDLYDI
jgi:hypothetical protein